MLTDDQLKKLKGLLESQYDWPCHYLFKFIAPKHTITQVEALFPNCTLEKRQSRKGNYFSLTANIELESADVVIAIYQKASLIEGLIAL